jgi:hypothetical protein
MGMKSHLEVVVFQSSHDDAVDAVLGNVEVLVLAELLVV